MSRAADLQGSLPEQESLHQKEGKVSKKEKKRIRRKLKMDAKAEMIKQEDPEMVRQEQPVVKQEQIERSADADTAMDHDSESEWEGFPDPPTSPTHMSAVVSQSSVGSSVVVDEPAIEGKFGIGALQESIAHQFPGEPRPATHVLLDLLDGPALRGLAAPSRPGNHTVHQLALGTRLWFDDYRGKQIRLGVVRKNKDPVIDMSGGRRNGILWIRAIEASPSQPGQKPTKFRGIQFITADIRLYEKESAKTNGGIH
ncbi:hypothetical protein CGRA01v4_01299 [Colletotrichum graminicola]|uniref:Uncharacterized protein n=1 Tax=Colletotrichum graminicola (strain M1.001 / M2 / FGSC 10212) TaxID=645133 RepID=E3QWE3_COLGM|nr:uncharacterized protein GLRG_10325 [Colletotrichum graminicola M1.001]EFQ35181.1 hypothetical protein GLRG_10325 [Colletotrichum graminicola M1.001]WDK10020.1 hypothetical protein CGRA01v4_01299 [Colletotrichum graminicola]